MRRREFISLVGAAAAATLLCMTISRTLVTSGAAMEFRIEIDPEEHISVVIGEGTIIEGDAARLENVIKQADRDRYGNIVLYLNSPGGSVAAAFGMVEVMDREEFTALVSSNAICASACASVVYVSARFHQIIGTGKLGIHSCYIKNNPADKLEPSTFCNDQIAQNAINHGTSYGAVNMWQREYGPETMAWIDKDVACQFGLCGPPGFDDTPATPSFDCRSAKQSSELAICSNKRLARHEASLAKMYFKTITNMPVQEAKRFRAEQRAWLKFRDTCQGPRVEFCLLDRMSSRRKEIVEKSSRY